MTDVLVVEPALLVREMITEALQDAGLRVTETASAEAALGAVEAASRPPEVLVTAIALHVGGMDGPALAAALRRRWPDLGVIYLAEHPGDLAEDALDAREHCLMKPFEPAQLTRLVCGLAAPCPNPTKLIKGRAVMR
jgi:CheY-like chemotaxis protein